VSPIVPEDGDRNTLTVTTVGSGTVTKEPDWPTYTCGDVVTLTAMANLGSTFGGWSGDLAGSTNPVTLTMMGSRTITATFTRDAYTLTVNEVGDGTVVVDPDQPTYFYGDVVTLTATPDHNWSFSDWGGDLSGSANPATLTMTSNKFITATFTADIYETFLPLVVRLRER
jgi:hypothetical protein